MVVSVLLYDGVVNRTDPPISLIKSLDIKERELI